MKIKHLESTELLILTGLCAIATVTAICIGHENAGLMCILTLLMAFVAFIAQYRHRKRVSTLQTRGRRRRHTAHEQ